MDVVLSVNGVPIRMTLERWFHIVENHDYLAGHYDDILDTVQAPDVVIRGYRGALIAARGIARHEYLAVIYREVSQDDGFIISAYITDEIATKGIVWKRSS